MNQSMILLPENDGAASCWSKSRFTVSQYDYGSNELKSDKKTISGDGV
jgi:hypothetical protein